MSDEQHHPHAPHETGIDEHDRAGINVPLVFTVGLISAILLVVIAIGTQAWYNYEVNQEHQRKVINAQNRAIQDMNGQAQSKLQGGAWVDQQRGRVSISIDRAMQQVSLQYQTTPAAERGALTGETALPSSAGAQTQASQTQASEDGSASEADEADDSDSAATQPDEASSPSDADE